MDLPRGPTDLSRAVMHRFYADHYGRLNPRVAAFVTSVDAQEESQTLALVVHGLMGQGGGWFAAQFVLKLAREAARDAQSVTPESGLAALLTRIHEGVPECLPGSGAGAMLSAAWFAGGRVAIAHAGTCRVYRQRPGEGIELLTEDHSLRNEVLRAGGSDVESVPHIPTRALGLEPNPPWELRVEPAAPGDVYMLSSSGVEPRLDTRIVADDAEDGRALQQALERVLGPRPLSGRDEFEAAAVLLRREAHPVDAPRELMAGL